MTYRGRFAPSPTGPLHFGSLIAAVGSYLEARCNGGEWLVRIEDIDGPRCKPEWASDILKTLEAFGFEWDREPVYQSQRTSLYEAALMHLASLAVTYPCACTRKEIADSSMHGVEGAIYPGICRQGLAPHRYARAIRLLTKNEDIEFNDAVQGPIRQNVNEAIGDFVIKRADGPIAYQLAVVVDDAQQGITHIVRGADLLLSTPRQIYLQQLLMYGTPQYAHLPVMVNERGEKLSKQTGATPVDSVNAANTLRHCLALLGQTPPSELSLNELWQWALEHWDLKRVPRQNVLTMPLNPGNSLNASD